MDLHITVNGRPPRFCPFDECNVLLTSSRYKACKRHTGRYDLCMEVAKSLVERHNRKPILGLGRYSPRDVAIDLLMKRVNCIVPNRGTGIIFSNDPLDAEDQRITADKLAERGDYVSDALADHFLSLAGWPINDSTS